MHHDIHETSCFFYMRVSWGDASTTQLHSRLANAQLKKKLKLNRSRPQFNNNTLYTIYKSSRQQKELHHSIATIPALRSQYTEPSRIYSRLQKNLYNSPTHPNVLANTTASHPNSDQPNQNYHSSSPKARLVVPLAHTSFTYTHPQLHRELPGTDGYSSST